MIRYLTTIVLVFALAPSTLFAQTPTQPTKRFSLPLAAVGGLTTAAGLAFLLSTFSVTEADPDGENWKLYDSNYCVTSGSRTFDIERGRCSTGTAGLEASFRPYAYGAIAAGLVMLKVGLIKVKVKEQTVTLKPVFAYDSAAVHGTVSWGGAK